MAAVDKKGLDWADEAPFSFTGSATTTASPDAIFAILANHPRWPDWFPMIKKTVVVGPVLDGVGLERVTTIPGGELHELFIEWDPGRRMAFTCTAISPPISRGLLDVCYVERADERTNITYTTYLDPVAPLLPVMKLLRGVLNRQLDKGMRALAALAEKREAASA